MLDPRKNEIKQRKTHRIDLGSGRRNRGGHLNKTKLRQRKQRERYQEVIKDPHVLIITLLQVRGLDRRGVFFVVLLLVMALFVSPPVGANVAPCFDNIRGGSVIHNLRGVIVGSAPITPQPQKAKT